MAGTKSLPPTPKRVERARAEGRVVKSPFLTQVLVVFSSLLGLIGGVRLTWVKNQILLEYCLVSGVANPWLCAQVASAFVLKIVGTCLIVGILMAVMVEGAQVGFRVDFRPLSPQLSRLDFGTGIKRIWQGGLAGLSTLLKLLLIVTGLILVLPGVLNRILALRGLEKWEQLRLLLREEYSLFCGVFFALIGCAGIDYLRVRRKFRKELGMSHEELRREMREDEGDPIFRSMRRAKHEALVMSELVTQVRRAKVIVVERM